MDHLVQRNYRKMTIKWSFVKIRKIGFQDQLSLNAGQKNCRMLQRENSAILSTFIKLPFVIKIFILSIFEWLFYTGFTVRPNPCYNEMGYIETAPYWENITIFEINVTQHTSHKILIFLASLCS